MKRYFHVATLVAAAGFAGLMVWMGPAQAQAPIPGKGAPPAAKGAPNAGKGAPRPIGMEDGLTYFQTKCMSCHAEQKAKATTARKIREMTAEQIYAVIAKPSRPEHDQGLTDPQKQRLAEFMGGYTPLGAVAAGNPSSFANRCPSNPALSDPFQAAAWSGWGADASNTRSQTAEAAGITAAQVPNLKLKWAFGFPKGITAWGQPAIAAGRVYVGADTGWVYSLDAKTGCVYWGYQSSNAMRPAISIGPVTGRGSSKYAIYFGDSKGNAYAVDAQNGELLWKKKMEDFFLARITGAPKLYNGKIYVPVSSSEEWQSGNPDYECCTSRGSVVALDASTGTQLWKTYVMEDPKPTKKNPNGVQLYGPAGGSVWNSPTIDPVRNAI
ncbi:MAG: PQQ-binding-like beta-propeller repeat protein, partial [Acidobacteriota bacterium]